MSSSPDQGSIERGFSCPAFANCTARLLSSVNQGVLASLKLDEEDARQSVTKGRLGMDSESSVYARQGGPKSLTHSVST